MTTLWMRRAPYAILFVIILLGIIFLPLSTLLMTVGGLAIVGGIVLLIFVPRTRCSRSSLARRCWSSTLSCSAG